MIDKNIINKCKRQLINLKKQYSKTLSSPRHYSGEGDHIDLAFKENYIHHSSGFRSRINQLLPEIVSALKRIEDGTFGICEITGEAIETKRLLAVPWTRVSMMALHIEEAS